MDKLPCETVTSLSGLTPYLAEWDQLCERSTEDNLYMSPTFLLASLRHFERNRQFYIVFAFDQLHGSRRLIGCAAFSLVRPAVKVPFWTLSTISAPHQLINNPLLDRDQPAEAIRLLWDWVEDKSHTWRMVRLTKIREDLPSWQFMESELRKRGRIFLVRQRDERAVLHRFPSFDDYLASLPSKRRKHYQRYWRKLCRAGAVEVKLHHNLRESPDLAERFMKLEASGWKGISGSAMLSSDKGRAFLGEVLDSLGRQDRLFVVELTVDGAPIAMTLNFVRGRTLFAFKIGYSVLHARYSPGILAEVNGVRLFLEQLTLSTGDGGNQGTSFIDSYWRGRTFVDDILVSTPHLPSRMFVGLLPRARWLKRKIEAWIRRRTPVMKDLSMSSYSAPVVPSTFF